MQRPGGTRPAKIYPTVNLTDGLVGRPFHQDGLLYEAKVDGWRILAYKDAAEVKLLSRAGKDHTRRFTNIATAIRALPHAMIILDGEVAVFDANLISRFEWLRGRPKGEASTHPVFMAFDCLYLDGRDLRELPLHERRALLERAIEGDQRLVFPVPRLAANGLEAWQEVIERGYEGYVAKDPDSQYRGGRTLSWLKVKQPSYREGERGWEPTGKS
jgi:bifunctional non-homologous end joining protein LigD